MSVEDASMASGMTGETPVVTPVNVPASLGTVGYAAFALLQAIPLSKIVPFPLVVSAFEAESNHLVPTPAPVPAPVVAELTPQPPPQPVPQPAMTYSEDGYRPEPGPQLWGRGVAPVPAAAVSAQQDWAAPVAAVAVAAPTLAEGYAADRPTDDRKARQVLDELSFLFDEN